MKENEEIKEPERYCIACKAPLIKVKKKIAGTDWEVEVSVCSKQKTKSCI